VLLDAPCTATGTIRRHPDILRLKRTDDIAALADVQGRLLDNAVRLLAPGGTLIYCTCSLEPEEGVQQIERLLARAPQLQRVPIVAGEHGIAADWITADGDLRTLPFHLPLDRPELSGLDGFYAARLVSRS
jgi:16S rRNA (cytosine967-C5)-methyltransferase